MNRGTDNKNNFHSAEFNQTDDLNDCSGNYLTFQPLDGVVTADMRHQMERLRRGDVVDAAMGDAVPSKNIEREKDEDLPRAATPLAVISRGRTLIVDTDTERSIACGKLLSDQGLACTLLMTKKATSDASFPRCDQLTLLEVDAVSITGAFGGFSAMVTVNGDQQALSEWFGDEASVFDLVLDLQSAPSYAGDRLPMGYYAPGANSGTLPEVMAELPEMRGRFHKPQFTTFLKHRCLHGRSRTLDCRQCLAVCAFGAIQSADRTISIDHYRCQGCGGCAMVCPADAIHMVHPSQEEMLSTLQRTLGDRSAGAVFPPTLVISDVETADGREPPERDEGDHHHLVNFEVEQIGYAGLEMILAALAYGAGVVVVACGAQNSPKIRNAAEWQAQMGRAILRGLGMPEDKIRFALSPPENNRSEKWTFSTTGPEPRPDKPLLPPATFSPGHDKRTLVRLATQHLYDQSGVRQPSIPLPAGSPFGAVTVDPVACTLCMACAFACPSGALSAKGDVPRLEFLESRCHQCRLCEEACPEGAIRLLPRILCDPDVVEAPAVLNEAEPIRCIECGVPFASQAMINHIQGKLTGHWMYAGDRQLRRLYMCRHLPYAGCACFPGCEVMESVMKTMDASGWFAAHATIRTDGYVMLASLLGQTPSEDLLNILRNLHWDEAPSEPLDRALGALRRAAYDYSLDALKDEFNKLFVGLGSGEIVPYASWYREKKIQSTPLASLRSDLMELGIVRQTDCHESEDHAGALCEIMAILSQKANDIPHAAQAGFFHRHVAPWMMTFFEDLQSAKSAEFYRVVGLFGSCFLEIESEYLGRGANTPFPKKEGGLQNENGTFRQPADIL